MASDLNRALGALQFVLVWARDRAYAGESAQATEILDGAEYLAVLPRKEGGDIARSVRYLEGMAKRIPELAGALEQFGPTPASP